MEFQDTIWSNNLIDRLEELGATSVDMMTFQHNDGNQSAAGAYNRVRKVAANSGFILITSGTANPKLLAKADDLLEKEKQKASEEFDEKTQAAIKQSLAEISEAMVTKDDLYSLGESSHKGFEEIKERMKSDHEQIIVRNVKTFQEFEKIINDQQQIINNLESKNHRQSCVLARLNQERDETARELKKLHEENHALKASFYGNHDGTTMVEMVTEIWQEIKRRRSQP